MNHDNHGRPQALAQGIAAPTHGWAIPRKFGGARRHSWASQHSNIDPAGGSEGDFPQEKKVHSVISIDVSESIRVYPCWGDGK